MDIISAFLSNIEETEEMKKGWISWAEHGVDASELPTRVAQYLKCPVDSLLIVTTESAENPTLYVELIAQCHNKKTISMPDCSAASATLGSHEVVLTNEHGMGTIWISLPNVKWPEEIVNFSLDESKMSKTINRKILREMIIKEIVEDVPARAKRLAAAVAELIKKDKAHFTNALVSLLKTSMPYQSSEFEVSKLSDGIRKKISSEIEYITSKIPGMEKLDVYQAGKIIASALKNLHESKDNQEKIREVLREMIIKELRYLKSDG